MTYEFQPTCFTEWQAEVLQGESTCLGHLVAEQACVFVFVFPSLSSPFFGVYLGS